MKQVIDLSSLKGHNIDRIVGPRSPIQEVLKKFKFDEGEA